MSLSFGHDDLKLNHIHNVKPLVALPYYQMVIKSFRFVYYGIAQGSSRNQEPEREHWPRRDILMENWVEEKNTQIQLLAHTFDADSDIIRVVMRYEVRCIMKDGTIEYWDLDEFSIIPYKITSGIVDGMNLSFLMMIKNFCIGHSTQL